MVSIPAFFESLGETYENAFQREKISNEKRGFKMNANKSGTQISLSAGSFDLNTKSVSHIHGKNVKKGNEIDLSHDHDNWKTFFNIRSN